MSRRRHIGLAPEPAAGRVAWRAPPGRNLVRDRLEDPLAGERRFVSGRLPRLAACGRADALTPSRRTSVKYCG